MKWQKIIILLIPLTFLLSHSAYSANETISSPEAITLEGPSILEAESEVAEVSDIGILGHFNIEGYKVITFTSRSIEGTKEGFLEGQTREESLRLNITGRAADTDVEANIYSLSSAGTTTLTEREEKVSVRLRRASTEVYFGDFTAQIRDVEFARLDKELSGVKVTGDYDTWGFKALYSTPKGEPYLERFYGDGTQGPYELAHPPVVIDSERVYLNGVLQKRGDDYEIDYKGGSIAFKNKTIIDTWIIKVEYDHRETIYQHSTYGLRVKGKVLPNVKLGATYLNDSDSKTGASEIFKNLSSTIEPTSHQVIGIDGTFDFGKALNVKSEFAYSDKDLNILSSTSTKERDSAFKIETSSDMGPLSVETKLKRIGPDFNLVAVGSPKKDLREGGVSATYKPNNLFFTKGEWVSEDYKEDDIEYAIERIGSEIRITPKDMPSFNYFYNQDEESNDPVTGNLINRLTARHAGDVKWRNGFLQSSIKGSHEKRTNRSPSEEVTTYKTIAYGLSTVGLEQVTVSSNIEFKETENPDKSKPLTKTYDLKLSTTPIKGYFASLSLNQVDDTEKGLTTVTELNYRAKHSREFETDGKYTINSIKETFSSSEELVSKQVGSFKFKFRPIREIRFIQTYKPSFTHLAKNGVMIYHNMTNQSELNWQPLRYVSTGVLYKIRKLMNVDKTDYPDYRRLQDATDAVSTTLTLKYAPWRFLSTELNYFLEDSKRTELASTEPVSYGNTDGKTKELTLNIRTPLSEKFSLDSSYTNKKEDVLSYDASREADTLTQTGKIKFTWNINESWSLIGSTSYSEEFDNLATQDKITYTISPGVGFIYRLVDTLRVDGEATYSKSHAGAKTEKSTYSLKTKYDMNEYVHMTLNLEREISVAPDYRTLEILANLEITL